MKDPLPSPALAWLAESDPDCLRQDRRDQRLVWW